jgi:hypothetical protein
VQIWEIEPAELMIARLPDAVIDDFAGLLRETVEGSLLLKANGSRELRTAVRAARLCTRSSLIAEHFSSLQRWPCFAQLVHAAAQAAPALRTELVAGAGAVRQLIYLLYPAWIRKQLLANSAADDEGRFQTRVFPSRHCARLNLYFTASATVQGVSLPVFDPKPVAAAIYWDYPSGREVVLDARSTDGAWNGASPVPDAAIARDSVSSASPPHCRSA